MNRCHCQSPPAWADGGSARSGSPAAGLPQSAVPGGVLGLYALRPRTALLRRPLPHRRPAAAMPCCQPSLPVQSGRAAGPSGPATGIPRTSRTGSRDGSIFPFGHFSGTIRVWRNDHGAGGDPAANPVSRPAGKASRFLAGLLPLWPARPLCQSFPWSSTTEVIWDDQS